MTKQNKIKNRSELLTQDRANCASRLFIFLVTLQTRSRKTDSHFLMKSREQKLWIIFILTQNYTFILSGLSYSWQNISYIYFFFFYSDVYLHIGWPWVLSYLSPFHCMLCGLDLLFVRTTFHVPSALMLFTEITFIFTFYLCVQCALQWALIRSSRFHVPFSKNFYQNKFFSHNYITTIITYFYLHFIYGDILIGRFMKCRFHRHTPPWIGLLLRLCVCLYWPLV